MKTLKNVFNNSKNKKYFFLNRIIFFIILIFAVSVVLSPSVFSIGTNSEDNWYACDTSAGKDSLNNDIMWDNGTTPVLLHVDGPASQDGVLKTAAPKVGNASCDINNVGTDALLNSTSTDNYQMSVISFSFWVKLDVITAGRYLFNLKNTTPLNFFQFNESANNISFDVNQVSVSTPVSTGNWYHFAGIAKNNEKLTLWVNTTPINSSTAIGILPILRYQRAFGYGPAGDDTMDGQLDDIRFWYNYTITQTDVNFLYNSFAGTNASLNTSATPDTTVPTFDNNATNNTAPKINEAFNMSINISDETALSHYVFAWDNGTGTFTNDTAIVFPASTTEMNRNVTKTIQRVRGTTMQWRWHANDTTNNWNVSTTYSVVVANTVPTILTENTFVNVSAGHYFNVTANATDADAGTDIISTSISSTSGSCTLLGNSTGGNNFGVRYNCSGTGLQSTTIRIGFEDAGGGKVNTTASSNTYPDNSPTAPTVTAITPSTAVLQVQQMQTETLFTII